MRQPRFDDAADPSPDPSAEEMKERAAESLRRLKRDVVAHIGAWRIYLATRGDKIRHGLVKLALRLGAGLLALTAAVALTVTASILLLTGIAGFVSALFPEEPWTGPLAAGVLGLGGMAGLFALASRAFSRSFLAGLEKKYGPPGAGAAPRAPNAGSGAS